MKSLRRRQAPNDSERNPASSVISKTLNLRFTRLEQLKKRRRSPIFRKCEDLMEQLWEKGYRKKITYRDLRFHVEMICGAFRSTVVDYLGKRATYYRGRGRIGVLKSPGKHGYLERFGFIEMKSRKIVTLLHERVDRPYHYLQSNIVSFSLSNSVEGNERIVGAVAPTNTDYTTTTQRERENRESESILELTTEELRILRASLREGD